jgi:hypothetical protein
LRGTFLIPSRYLIKWADNAIKINERTHRIRQGALSGRVYRSQTATSRSYTSFSTHAREAGKAKGGPRPFLERTVCQPPPLNYHLRGEECEDWQGQFHWLRKPEKILPHSAFAVTHHILVG